VADLIGVLQHLSLVGCITMKLNILEEVTIISTMYHG